MNRVRFVAWIGLALIGATALAAEPRPYLLAYNRTNLAATMREGGHGSWGMGPACGCEAHAGPGCGSRHGGLSPAPWQPSCGSCGMSDCGGGSILGGLIQHLDCALRSLCGNPCGLVRRRPGPCRSLICVAGWKGGSSCCDCDCGGGDGGGYGDGGGPGTGYDSPPKSEMNWSPSNESDPFRDDELRAPPPAPADARAMPPYRRAAVAHTRLTSADSVLVERVAATISLNDTRRNFTVTDGPHAAESPRMIQHIRFEDSTVPADPRNPLRRAR